MPHPTDRRAFFAAAVAATGYARARLAYAAPENSPAIPIVDTHQHLWDPARLELPWLAHAPADLRRRFDLDDFRSATTGLNVAKTVYMEVDVRPDQQALEAELVIALCREPGTAIAGAVIGGSPHERGFAEYLRRFANEPSVKGVRSVLHGDRPRGLCLRPTFVDSMNRLADAGLTFDLCMRPEEIGDGAKLAAACPGTSFVLDHCGNIGFERRRSPRWRTWSDGVKAAADLPNVVCKISGLVDKPVRPNWTAADLAENVDFCLDAFGEDRVLFGGDWPVCLIGGAYRRWVDALQAVVAGRPETFRRKLFHDNAVRVYRLDAVR